MKRLVLFISMVLIAGLSACAVRALAPASAPGMPSVPMATAAAAPRLLPAAGGAPSVQDNFAAQSELAKTATQGQAPTTDRLVVKTADLSIVVKDVNARVTAIQNMANAMGGFIVSANVYQITTSDGTKVPQAQVVVRVPQERLDEALSQIKQDTVEVQSESRSGRDVTDQYVDLQSRLAAKQAAEQKLLEIMQNATKTQDVLDVYSQLQQVETDIEVLKGQIKYTEQSASLSAISVNIAAEETIKPLQVGGWKPQGVARDAIQNLIYFWQGFVDFMIRFFLLILPILITIAIPFTLAFLLIRWIVRKLRKPQAAQPEAPKKK
jgi:hypothetical protein